MRRVVLLALLMVSATLASAQRGIVGLPHTGTPGCCTGVHTPHGFPSHGHLWFPFYPFWYEDDLTTSRANSSAPAPPAPTQPLAEQAWRPTAKAQILEVPNSNTPTEPNPQRSTVFVLKDGSRIYAHRYLLTAKTLSVSLGQLERQIPFSELDVNATLAANRDQGIALRIPADPGEVALGF